MDEGRKVEIKYVLDFPRFCEWHLLVENNIWDVKFLWLTLIIWSEIILSE